jgi:hypothetical protein
VIKLKDLHKGSNFDSLPPHHQNNLETTYARLKALEAEYLKEYPGHDFVCTSGYRSLQDHLRIYKQMGITDQSKIPMKSRHLEGAAADIYDPDGNLWRWTYANRALLEKIGLWCEDDRTDMSTNHQKQPRVHYQINPPRSGSRFFKP